MSTNQPPVYQQQPSNPQPPKKAKKPIYRRGWFIVLAIIVLLVVVTRLGGGSSDSGDSNNSGSNTTSQSQRTSESQSDQQEAKSSIDSSYGTFDAVDYSGAGAQIVPLPATSGIVYATHSGASNFSLTTLNEENEPTGDLLVNTIGSYEGTTAYGMNLLTASGTSLQIDADGAWTIHIAPLSSAEELTTPADGSGDAVYIYSGKASTWNITHHGVSNFTVSEYGSWDPLLVNEIGTWSGQVPVKRGPAVVTITADGNWSIS